MNENENLQPVEKLTPFTKMIMSIGTLPSSFYSSMSYYESMVWLYEYLKNTVIPTVNNNGEAVEELQEKYIDLKDAFETLESYIENYFNNLDVQQEINNKLDEMAEDGTLTNLIKNYIDPLYSAYEDRVDLKLSQQDDEISNFKSSVNSSIDTIESQVISATSGAPIPVSSTSQMLDTSKIYVNTTDGNWYYYDGDSWEIGGTYQSTGIGIEEVNILNFDKPLRANFTPLEETLTADTTVTDKYCKVINTNELSIVTSAGNDYKYKTFNLKNNMIYDMFAWEIADLVGFIIADENDEVVYSTSVGQNRSVATLVYGRYKTPATGTYTAYMSYQDQDITDNPAKPYLTILGIIREFKENKTNINYYDTFELITEVEGHFIDNITPDTFTISTLLSGYSYKMFALRAGYTYQFHYTNKYTCVGLTITDLEFNLLYQSSTTNVGGNLQQGDYTITPENDCYAFLSSTDSSKKPYARFINNQGLVDKIGFNKLYAIGDSITEVNFRALHNYLYWIKNDLPTLEIENLGVSGTGYHNAGGVSNTFINRISSIFNYNLDTDVIIVMGSVNDVDFAYSHLGHLGDTTTDTVYGCMYQFFNTLFTRFNGVRVGAITPLNWKNSDNISYLPGYIQALEDTCKLFKVPFLNLYDETNLRPDNSTFLNEYYLSDGDNHAAEVDATGVHPNSAGHKLIYARIKEFIIKL